MAVSARALQGIGGRTIEEVFLQKFPEMSMSMWMCRFA